MRIKRSSPELLFHFSIFMDLDTLRCARAMSHTVDATPNTPNSSDISRFVKNSLLKSGYSAMYLEKASKAERDNPSITASPAATAR